MIGCWNLVFRSVSNLCVTDGEDELVNQAVVSANTGEEEPRLMMWASLENV